METTMVFERELILTATRELAEKNKLTIRDLIVIGNEYCSDAFYHLWLIPAINYCDIAKENGEEWGFYIDNDISCRGLFSVYDLLEWVTSDDLSTLFETFANRDFYYLSKSNVVPFPKWVKKARKRGLSWETIEKLEGIKQEKAYDKYYNKE